MGTAELVVVTSIVNGGEMGDQAWLGITAWGVRPSHEIVTAAQGGDLGWVEPAARQAAAVARAPEDPVVLAEET